MLINKQIPSLYDGVSQQPASMRLPAQNEVQINGWSTVVQGVGKRPPTQHVASLGLTNPTDAHIHVINRDVNERYIVSITDGDLQVFDLAGNAKTVNFPYGKGYLKFGGADPVAWVASYVPGTTGVYVKPTAANGFIYQVSSIQSAASAGGTTEPTWPTEAGQTVTSGQLVYTCFVDFTGATLNAQSDFGATSVADYTFIVNKTVYVQMQSASVDQLTQPTGYYYLSRDFGNDYYGEANYSYAAAYQYSPNPAGTLKGTVQSFDYLPWPGNSNNNNTPADGDVYCVQGDAQSDFTAYYVIWQNGVWNETVKPGLQNGLEAGTMPWALVRNADGTFTFAPFSWNPRKVGDDTTNPTPSFVNRQIRDIFFYQNRLGICVDENVVLSRAGDFGTFFRLTVTQLLADSVIDVGASETEVTVMNFAVPFATGMMLFSDQTQFRLMTPIDGSLTPTTVALDVATRFLSSTTVRPIMLGSNVYFISEDSAYAHVREYFVKLNYLGQFSMDAPDITAHVPKYLPKGCYLLTGSLLHNCLFVATSAYPNRLYTYQMYWLNEQQKGQSAWHYWDFGTGTNVLAASALDDYLYVLIERGGTVFIEKVSLALGANVGLADSKGNLYDILLDRRTAVTGTYLSADDTTIFTLPYTYDQSLVQLVATDGATPGALSDPTKYAFYSATQIKVPGNVAGNYLAGESYTFTLQFSQQFMPNQQGQSVLTGRLTLRNWTVSYVGSAFFEATVDPYGNGNPATLSYVPAQEASYSGLTIGESALEIGSPTFGDGAFTFGVFGESKEATIAVSNATPYPSIFVSAEWEADFTDRSRTI